MVELSRDPKKSAEPVRAVEKWLEGEFSTIMHHEGLTPHHKRMYRQQLREAYRNRWELAFHDAMRDLGEWREVFRSRAEAAAQPKIPKDGDARILTALELQRTHNRIERYRDQPGRLLADYEKAVRAGDGVVAHELEEALPELLPKGERENFLSRAQENKRARLSESDRKKIEEAEAFEREAEALERGLDLQRTARHNGYIPEPIMPTTLVTSQPPGRPLQTDEVPNILYREPSADNGLVTQPVGGVIGPDPGTAPSSDPGSAA